MSWNEEVLGGSEGGGGDWNPQFAPGGMAGCDGMVCGTSDAIPWFLRFSAANRIGSVGGMAEDDGATSAVSDLGTAGVVHDSGVVVGSGVAAAGVVVPGVVGAVHFCPGTASDNGVTAAGVVATGMTGAAHCCAGEASGDEITAAGAVVTGPVGAVHFSGAAACDNDVTAAVFVATGPDGPAWRSSETAVNLVEVSVSCCS